MTTILIIDDDVEFCETMESLVSRMRYACEYRHDIKSGLARLADDDIDVVFLDVQLPDGNGLDALPRIKASPSKPEVIILTGRGDPDGAELAIKGGVWDYLVKPTSVKNTRLSLQRALKFRREKQHPREPVSLNIPDIIGQGPKMKACFDLVAKAAVSDSQVLITGETGTGKECFARAIHDNSLRAGQPFVVVDCASLTESLLESTLFGHRKGAFTGADTDRVGLIKLADRGTLFLDEVGEMPLSIQKSFLRVLQEKRFRPLGDTREVKSDFRLIAATHRDLEIMSETGEFRQDLLFRLWSISLKLPPLRERLADLKPLVMYYVNKRCEESHLPVKGFEDDFFEVLKAYDWPGNVRELFNVLERAFVVAGDDKSLYAMHLPQNIRIKVAKNALQREASSLQAEAGYGQARISTKEEQQALLPEQFLLRIFNGEIPDFRDYKHKAQKWYLEAVIEQTGGSIQDIIRISGLSKSQLYALLKKNNIKLKTG